jgi:tripartite-type tricarboxylate transporter receptor subunit TctC
MCERTAEESVSRPCVAYGQDEAKRGMKGFTAQSYIGILAPADVTAKLQNVVEKGLTQGSAAAERLVALGSEVATPEQMKPKESTEFISTNYDAMCEVAELAGIKPT